MILSGCLFLVYFCSCTRSSARLQPVRTVPANIAAADMTDKKNRERPFLHSLLKNLCVLYTAFLSAFPVYMLRCPLYFLDSQTRATALHRLLSQAVCSLMTQEKQMPPFRRRLFFFCVHHMLTLSAISAILDSFSLVSPLTLE